MKLDHLKSPIIWQWALFGFLVVSCASAVQASESNKKPESKQAAAPQESDAMKSDFVIGPGDMLGIFVWKEAELTRNVPVRPDGKISLPLINDIQAAGLTALELRDRIAEKLKCCFTDPSVTVTVVEVKSQRVVILGEVTTPGPRPLAGPTKVMEMLATAGFTPFAKKSKIHILRNENGKQVRHSFNLKDFVKGKNLEQNIELKSGDTIVVP